MFGIKLFWAAIHSCVILFSLLFLFFICIVIRIYMIQFKPLILHLEALFVYLTLYINTTAVCHMDN